MSRGRCLGERPNACRLLQGRRAWRLVALDNRPASLSVQHTGVDGAGGRLYVFQVRKTTEARLRPESLFRTQNQDKQNSGGTIGVRVHLVMAHLIAAFLGVLFAGLSGMTVFAENEGAPSQGQVHGFLTALNDPDAGTVVAALSYPGAERIYEAARNNDALSSGLYHQLARRLTTFLTYEEGQWGDEVGNAFRAVGDFAKMSCQLSSNYCPMIGRWFGAAQ